MPKYEVINEFIDLEANKQRRRPGDVIEVSEGRAKTLVEKKLIKLDPVPDELDETETEEELTTAEDGVEAVEKDEGNGKEEPEDTTEEEETKPEDEKPEFPKHVGGGYYELSNGEKIKGKEKALEAERKLGGE